MRIMIDLFTTTYEISLFSFSSLLFLVHPILPLLPLNPLFLRILLTSIYWAGIPFFVILWVGFFLSTRINAKRPQIT